MGNQNNDSNQQDNLDYMLLKEKYNEIEKKLEIQKQYLENESLRQKSEERRAKIAFLEENKVFEKLQVLWLERKNPNMRFHPIIEFKEDVKNVKELLIILMGSMIGLAFILFLAPQLLISIFICYVFLVLITIFLIFYANQIGDKSEYKKYIYSYKKKDKTNNIIIELSSALVFFIFNKSQIIKLGCELGSKDDLVINKESIVFSDDFNMKNLFWLNEFNNLLISLTNYFEADLQKRTSLLEQQLIENSYDNLNQTKN